MRKDMIAITNLNRFKNRLSEYAGEVFDITFSTDEIRVKIKLDIAKTNFKKLVKCADNYDYKTRTFVYKVKQVSECEVESNTILIGFGEDAYEDTLHIIEREIELLSKDFEQLEAVIFADNDLDEIIKKAGKAKKSKPRTSPARRKPSLSGGDKRHMAQEMLDDGLALSNEQIMHLPRDERHLARKLSHS